MSREPTIPELFLRIRQLLAEANAMTGEDKPRWRRLLYASRAKARTDEAQDLLDEITLRIGQKVEDDGRPYRLGPFTRIQWLVLQWFVGIWNAVTMVLAIADGRWISAVFSLLSMLATTLWVLPRKPRKTSL